jgi:hypothetical protein
MKRVVFVTIVAAAAAVVVGSTVPASGQADGEAVPIFGIKIPHGYRDWKLISVAHEEGKLNSFAAILGNDVAIKAGSFRTRTVQSLPLCTTVTSRRRKTTKSLAIPNLSFQGPQRTFSSWSRTQENTPRRAAGGSRTSTQAANLATRRCSKPVSLATRRPLATSSSPDMHLDTGYSSLTLAAVAT